MDMQAIRKVIIRRYYYLPTMVIPFIAIVFCAMVYLAGEISNIDKGYEYLIGIPNYYIFYLFILPFVSSGIVFIATRNANVRFFGNINEGLDEEQAKEILFYRKLLLVIAIIFSFVVTINDASEKGHTLAPYSISLNSELSESQESYTLLVNEYFELKKFTDKLRKDLGECKNIQKDGFKEDICLDGLLERHCEYLSEDERGEEDFKCLELIENESKNRYYKLIAQLRTDSEDCIKSQESGEQEDAKEEKDLKCSVSIKNFFQKQYLKFIEEQDYDGKSATGFQSVSSWYHNSSIIYKFESFLSWIAALTITVFFAQIFLLIIIKEHVESETKNLISWLIILCSFWIPCKIFSEYYYSLNPDYKATGIAATGIVLVVFGVMHSIFIKLDNNDMSKYATMVLGLLSVIVTSISMYKPLYETVLYHMSEVGWVYGGMLLFILVFTIFLYTKQYIAACEKSL